MSRGLDRETSFVPKFAFVSVGYKTLYPSLRFLHSFSHFHTMPSSTAPNFNNTASSSAATLNQSSPPDPPSAVEIDESSAAFRESYGLLLSAKKTVMEASTTALRQTAVGRFMQILVSASVPSLNTFFLTFPPENILFAR
jgi:hypothetical protein